MGFNHPSRVRAGALLIAATIAASLMVGTSPAVADTAPVDPTVPETVSTDLLPTVQINGVVWSQTIVGDVVYAGGNFSTAQPAGAAAGVNTVPRTHLLAYDIRTGDLITSFAPVLNGQVRVVTASPDGSVLYVGGEFTTVDGQSRSRIAAFSTATGALIPSFAPVANTRVFAIAATDSVVYMGGWFSAVNNTPRSFAAAVSATSGELLPFAPEISGGSVASIVVSPDQSKVVLGGSFTHLNGFGGTPGTFGVAGNGIGWVTASTGSALSFPAAEIVHNGGPNASITNLSSDADSIYGTAYKYGPGGNLEGAFRASWATGELIWLQDCHGDSYSIVPKGDAIYVAGHPHYCSNVDSFPQTSPTWTFQRAMAWTKDVRGTITRDQKGYFNFEGNPRPEALSWWPDLLTGSFTGQGQAAWSVAANDDYVVVGGEFVGVNNKRQQGLVRFAVKSIAPNQDGPRLSGANFVPNVASLTAGTARVAWKANYDRDNENLTYELYRDGAQTPIFTTTANSRVWFNRPQIAFSDTGLTPGQTYSYRIRATDAFGNTALGNAVSVTVSGSGTLSPYATAVVDDGAASYWRMGESSGTVLDWIGAGDAVPSSNVARNVSGAIADDSNTAAGFNGTDAFVATTTLDPAPDRFALEAWFKTTSTAGGKIVGFGASNTGNSSTYDRHVYMDAAGRVAFGVFTGARRTVQSTASFNDGEWHQVVANLGPNGMELFVDGAKVGSRTDTTAGLPYSGFWRIGGDSSWSGARYFNGTIDDVSLYTAPLSQAKIIDHFTKSGRQSTVAGSPADAYGARIYADSPDLYWRLGESAGTTAADSSIAGNAGTYSGGVTLRGASGISGTSNTSARFDGATGLVASKTAFVNPQVYSVEAWFNSTTTAGGKIVGFGNSDTGTSSRYDRHIYLTDDGSLAFGTYTGVRNLITTSAKYNDGAWHQVVATQSSAGLRLYVDGVLVGSDSATSAQNYTGYWRVGGDTTWGSSSTHVDARIDEVAVYGYALSADTVSEHFALGSGVTANRPPVASFTAVTTDLSVSFDAAASSDPDGSIASYSWKFGDSTTGSGVTATHVYPAAGTYTAELTVTDNQGAATTTTKSVIVSSANVVPVASFTSGVSGLSASVDGSGSSDSDGSITSFAWDFGDGTTASGATASREYAAAGTYTVTLTVTDNQGATGTTAKQVTVSAPDPGPNPDPGPGTATVLAQDLFGRTVTDGFGSADTGGAWSLTGPSRYFAVTGGVGQITIPSPGLTRKADLTSVSSSDTDVQTSMTLKQAVTGTGMYAAVVARRVGDTAYLSRVRILADGTTYLQLMRDSSSLESIVVPGLTYTAGDTLQMRVQAFGTSPTTVRAKVWKAGTSEPANWQVTTTDTTAALQQPGSVGLTLYLSSSATTTPLVITIDDFIAGSATGGTVTPPPPPAEPANVVPVASFTSGVSGLSASVDGSGSSDSDGSITSFAWDFGDGTTASGATASREYAAAGTYTVTLTVTDNQGATGTTAKQVTVSAPDPGPNPDPGPGTATVLAQDLFGRTVTDGFGSADTGGAWSLTGPSRYFAVTGGVGQITIPSPGLTRKADLTSVSSSDTDVQTSMTLKQAVTGTGMYAAVVARRVGDTAYLSRVRILADGTTYLQLMRDSSSLESIVVPGLTYTAGDTLQMRVQAFGTSPTTVRAKVWKAGTSEPANWQVTTTDTTAALQQPGSVGLTLYLSSSATTTPLVITIDDFIATVPQ